MALDYAGQPSTFTGELPPPSAGAFTLEVLALDANNVNFGLARQPIKVEP